MRWQMGRKSDNIEDRRGGGSAPQAALGGSVGVLVLALIAMALGIDPSVVLNSSSIDSGADSPSLQNPNLQNPNLQNPSSQNPNLPARRSRPGAAPVPPGQDQLAQFVSVVLADTEDTWRSLFREMGRTYEDPKLVLFSDSVNSACGFAKSAVGPFYCPSDRKVYIDLSFYQDLKNLHQAPGDFAQAYVIAHEVGHHVQNLLGISRKVQSLQQQVSQVQANQLSVRQELQADCFAGVWAHRAQAERQILEAGDIEEALNAASQIGDDHLQQQSRGYVTPESFTHGSSAQRVQWFTRGFKTGNVSQCNTFEASAT
ncbi:MAG: zinc metallopeptidase [Thermosynechococcaceae cyanobacterium MS004]|nr:zinc metallopeptidase [Thermosynechococcaceae cyanobacterium MS004]